MIRLKIINTQIAARVLITLKIVNTLITVRALIALKIVNTLISVRALIALKIVNTLNFWVFTFSQCNKYPNIYSVDHHIWGLLGPS